MFCGLNRTLTHRCLFFRKMDWEAEVNTAVVPEVGKTFLLKSYRVMLEIRQFEVKAQEIYRSGVLPGFIHLYIGEEAVATGVCATLQPNDLIFSTHRGHGHALAKGVSARAVFAELWGKSTGCSSGRGGSMHLFSPKDGLLGTNGIVGGTLPLATGAALAAKVRNSGQVAVSFFGDGAVNTGSFHESLTLGAIWDLPIVYVCENNMYATEMAFSRATKNTNVRSRAVSYGMLGVEVDGNDVEAIYAAADAAVRRARNGEGPTLIECKTYRYVGHHEGDPGTGYRTKEEVLSWKERCPIRTTRRKLLETGIATEDQLVEIEGEVNRNIDDAVEFARTSPEPNADSLLDNVF